MSATKVKGRWPRGTVLVCPTCNATTTVALPSLRVDCIGGLPAKHPKKEMQPQ